MVNSEDRDPETGDLGETIYLFPKRGEQILSLETYYYAPYKIRNIYREMMDAFNNGLFLLCSGGIRTIIEGICNEENIMDGPVEVEINGKKKIIRKKNLQGKISGLHEKSVLTKKHAEVLHELRFLGNDALHSLDAPAPEELKLAIDIVEHTLDNLYELSEKFERLKDKRERKAIKKN